MGRGGNRLDEGSLIFDQRGGNCVESRLRRKDGRALHWKSRGLERKKEPCLKPNHPGDHYPAEAIKLKRESITSKEGRERRQKQRGTFSL